MTIQEMARTYKRICKVYYADYCGECPLIGRNFIDATDCLNAIILHPDEYEKALLDWAKENPAPTNRDKFFAVFGDRKYKQFGCKKVCEPTPCCDCDWWNKEYVEPEKGQNK